MVTWKLRGHAQVTQGFALIIKLYLLFMMDNFQTLRQCRDSGSLLSG